MAKRGVTYRIEGLDEVLAELERRGANVKGEMTAALQAGGEVIAREAAGNVRSVSARVADAITVTVEETKGEKARVAVHIDKKAAFLARWIEYGTRAHEITPGAKRALLFGGRYVAKVRHPGTPARPFLRPAFDGKKDDAKETVRKRLAHAVGS